jgi:hypothetical protein
MLFATFFFLSAPAMLAIEYPWDRDGGGDTGNDGSGGGDGGDADSVIVIGRSALTSYEQSDEPNWFQRAAVTLTLWYLGTDNTEKKFSAR